TVAHSARVLLEQLADRRAHRELPRTRPFHLAACAVELRAGIARAAQAFEPVHSAVHDVRDVAEGLDVVHDGGLAPQADKLWERRLRARNREQPFKRAVLRRLIAADVAAGARVQVQLQTEAAAEDVLAEPTARARFVDSATKPLGREAVL